MSDDMPLENYAEYLETFTKLYRERMIGKGNLCKARGNAFFKMGVIHAEKGRSSEARKNFYSALRNDPLHARAYRALIKIGLWS